MGKRNKFIRSVAMNVGDIYKCEICDNIVELKEVGGGELVCCGQPMVKQES